MQRIFDLSTTLKSTFFILRGIRLLLLSILLSASMLTGSAAWAGESKAGDFDANGDGRITFEEVMKRLEKSARSTFDAMDRNNDGVLSDKDFDDVREGMKKLEDWLNDMIRPFLPEENSDEGPIEI